MKSPEELASRLARQWDDADLRESRLLRSDAWPLRLSIGKPSPGEISSGTEAIRTHILAWQRVRTGRVIWQSMRYRSLAEELSVPVAWELDKPSEWIDGTGNHSVRNEFDRLSHLTQNIDSLFHSFVIRQRHLVAHTPPDEIMAAANVAMAITPGIAAGAPLRSLSIAGIDSKFFERNRGVITRLLDIRFQSAVSDMGLETFLDAAPQSDQWLLLADLDGNLLPFRQIRVRDRELMETMLPGERLLIVENERCSHVLPGIKSCLALLGAGLNLSWMDAKWLANREVAYWGDIDTWGLTMLARAREKQPGLTPLLMTRAVFDRFSAARAVLEPVRADHEPPTHLSAAESELYELLLRSERGRLEQEFLPAAVVRRAILRWASTP